MPQPWLVVGAHDSPENPEQLKVEKTLWGFFLPHLGHFSSLSLSLMLRRASNFSPQLWHLYSYIGISFSF